MRVFIVKVWFPFVLLFGEWAVLRGAYHIIELALVPSLLALFYLTAVQIKPESQAIRYRYFYLFKWLQIPYEEILDCRNSLVPGLGVLKLRRFALPWGRIYFVREEAVLQIPFRRQQSALTSIINERREHVGVSRIPEKNHQNLQSKLWWFAAAVSAGAVSFFLIAASLCDAPPFDPKESPRLAVYLRFQEGILRWPWNLILGFLLISIIFALRFDKKTLPLAVSLGGLLGMLAAKIFL